MLPLQLLLKQPMLAPFPLQGCMYRYCRSSLTRVPVQLRAPHRPDIAAAAAAAAADLSASPSKAAAKVQFAQPRPPAALRRLSGETSSRSGETSLAAAVRALRPRALVGAAAAGGAFTPEVLKELAQVGGQGVPYR